MSEDQKAPEYKWGLRETTVVIGRESGQRRTVPALMHERCDGLAVTMFPFGVFSVTHTRSGMSLCNSSERASTALLNMSQFALVADLAGKSWTDVGNAQEAADLLKSVDEREVPFDGCTTTSRDGTRKMTVGEWFRTIRIPVFDEFPWEEKDPSTEAIENMERIGEAA